LQKKKRSQDSSMIDATRNWHNRQNLPTLPEMDKIYGGLAILLETIEAKEHVEETKPSEDLMKRKRKEILDNKYAFANNVFDYYGEHRYRLARHPHSAYGDINSMMEDDDFNLDREDTGSSDTEDNFEPLSKRKRSDPKKSSDRSSNKKRGRGRPIEPDNVNECQLCGETSTNTQYIGTTLKNTRRCSTFSRYVLL